MKRISSIDATRGIVMIIMALDHVRDFMHVNSVTQSPTNLDTTSPSLFFTRWITHICAPSFVFLAGTSVFVSLKKNNDIVGTRRFLLSRGIWLLVLEFTIMNFGFWFDIQFRTLIFEVIGTIGFGFIILSLLLNFRTRTILIIGISIIALHGLFPLIASKDSQVIILLNPLFQPGAIIAKPNFMFLMTYPPIPWLGVMLTGFAAGKLFEETEQKRKKLLLQYSILCFLLFVIIRFINIYGDPSPWTSRSTGLYTFLSFMNVSKYPPSLLFSLVTIGLTLLLLSITERFNNRVTAVTIVYGRVPLFYFIIHFYIAHIIMVVLMLMQGYHLTDLDFSNLQLGRPKGHSGLPLLYIYFVWIALVMMMYPLCKWYGNYKFTHPGKKWLRYI